MCYYPERTCFPHHNHILWCLVYWCFFSDLTMHFFFFCVPVDLLVQAWRNNWHYEWLCWTWVTCSNWIVPWRHKVYGDPRRGGSCHSREEGDELKTNFNLTIVLRSRFKVLMQSREHIYLFKFNLEVWRSKCWNVPSLNWLKPQS